MKQQSPGWLNVKVRIIRVRLEVYDTTVGIWDDFWIPIESNDRNWFKVQIVSKKQLKLIT